MRAKRRKTRGKTALVLLGLLGLGVAAWLVFRPQPAPPPAMLHPTAHQLAQAETHLQRFSQAVSTPGPGPRTLRLSESDLNVYLSGSQSARKLLSSHGVEAAQIVLLAPNDVLVHATIRLHQQPQNMEISGTLTPDAATGLRFTASSAQVGSLPLPASFVTTQANRLADRLSALFHRQLPMTVRSVSVRNKELVIVGVPVSEASPQSASPARH